MVRGHQLIKMGQLEIIEWHRIVKLIFKQMIECIEYIHNKKVAHFDISLENFLINDIEIAVDKESKEIGDKLKFVVDDDGKGLQVKLCDFGLAEYFSVYDNFQSKKWCGKLNYQSPEITNKVLFNAKSNDIFCLGVCLFMMIFGVSPWQQSSISDPAFLYIINGNLSSLLMSWNQYKYINHDLIKLFYQFFQFEPKRITMKQLKGSKWLQLNTSKYFKKETKIETNTNSTKEKNGYKIDC